MADTEIFQHYQVLKHPDGSLWELGRGAMGVTYKAFDTNLRCHVALKVINAAYLDSDMARQRFLREARAAAGMSHPNVASVFHLGQEGGDYFYAMEFIDGETLEAFVRREGPLPPSLALNIALQVTRALRAASREGLVHRDIKPANLMLLREDDGDSDDDGPELHVKVIDFGLAKVSRKDGSEASATITVAGFVGTPHFASPEQLEEKDLDLRSDMYSLGVTLWYMLVGRPPFGGSMVQIMSQHLTRKPDFEQLRGLPPTVARLLEHLLEKDPARRPQTATDLRREIEAAAREARDSRPRNAAPAGTVAPGGTAATHLPPESSFPTQAAAESDLPAGNDESVPAGEPATGMVLAGHYRLLRTVGHGAHGTLFQALELDGGQPVALKILPPGVLATPEAFARGNAAVVKARSAPHPSLLEVYSLERSGTHVFLSCEWVNGFTLVELMRHRRALRLDEALRCLEPLAAAADHARQAGLRDLDFSPDEVLLAFAATLELPTQSALLDMPVTQWPTFAPKVYPVSPGADAAPVDSTWTGMQTVVPAAASPPGAVRQLALLAYELLGGNPASHPQTTARPPLSALTEQGNSVLRQALSADGPPAFPRAADLIAALRKSVSARSADTGGTRFPVALAASAASLAQTAVPPTALPVSVVPQSSPGQARVRPSMPVEVAAPAAAGRTRSPLVAVLVLFTLVIVAGVIGGTLYAAWKIYIVADGHTRPAKEIANRHPQVLVPPARDTPRVVATPPPAATPLEVVTPSPPPLPPPTQADRAREMLAGADALERDGDDVGALAAYAQVAEDYPESDPGLSRLDSFVGRLRSKAAATEDDPRRVQRLRAPMEQAARLGSDTAMLYLGDHLLSTEPAAAAEWYRQAAAKGQPEAMVALGDMYYRGVGVELAPSQAARWYQLASDKGYPKAKVYLAECYELGKAGLARDYKKSFQLLNEALAIDPNNGDATEKLAEAYERGHGTMPDAPRAFGLMKRAVDLGNVPAIGNLGAYYIRGVGQKADLRKAVSLFKQGVAKDSAPCMFFYAQCLAEGLGGLGKDTGEAIAFYRAAAERGFPPAREWCYQNRVSYPPSRHPAL